MQLENFGLFGGHASLDLSPGSPTAKKTVVLIGGKNGAGKTTILEAVRIALYGKRALGTGASQSEYSEHLRGRIHRPPYNALAPRGAAVGLEFDYSDAGVVHHYRVRRSWETRGKSVVEDLVVEQDGSPFSGVPREQWQDFLFDLIPPGVSQLFFFDAEKIEDLATSEADQDHLAAAVRGLLGIDLVSRLREDLALYLSRQSGSNRSRTNGDLDAVHKQGVELEERVASLRETLADLRATRDAEAGEAERRRAKFIREGGEQALQRKQLEVQLEAVRLEIKNLQAELEDYAATLLPFSLAPNLLRALEEQLTGNRLSEAAPRKAAADSLRQTVAAIRGSKSEGLQGAWQPEHWADFDSIIKAWIDAAVLVAKPAGIEDGHRATVLEAIQDVRIRVAPRLRVLAKALDELSARQTELDLLLARGTSGDAGSLLEELREADKRVGAADAQIQATQREIDQLRTRQDQNQRQRKQLMDEQEQRVHDDRRHQLAARCAKALAQYEIDLTARKLEQLRSEFVARFTHLARKGDIISDVAIDPNTFSVSLIDRSGAVIPKAALSAGEKQIFAVAVLWALARTSGRPLPMIVDTPLARLDSDHRKALMERYLPQASHQVIVLSTDTEVDRESFASLKGSVSKAYCLQYHEGVGRTSVADGYFWQADHLTDRAHALQQA